MRDHMLSGLDDALFTTERAYYHGMVHAAGRPVGHKDWTITDKQIGDIYKRAVSNNRTVMRGLNWET